MSFTVYKSSAGSGKTFTLVKEYLKLALSDKNYPPQSYRHILAVTFTNKAAGEMKERIITALKELSQNNKTAAGTSTLKNILLEELKIDEVTLQKRALYILQAILHNYSDFAVGTIDSFVHKIVRTFAFDLKIPMNFEVELDAEQLLSQAIDLLISKAGSDEQLTKILVEFTESKTDEEKSWHIEYNLLEFAKNLIKEDNNVFIDQLKELSIADIKKIKNELTEKIKIFEHKIIEAAKNSTEFLNKKNIRPEAMHYGTKGIYGYFLKLAKGNLDNPEPGSYVKETIDKDKWTSKKATTQEVSAIDEIKPHLIKNFETIFQLIEMDLANYILFKLINGNMYALALLNEIKSVVNEIKAQNNIIHISEFNTLISNIVLNEPIPFIYERLGEKYHHYLIDEFQDTSALQWNNLLPLIDNSLAESHFNMIVGDGKQSIYRWRGSQVEQFSKLPEPHQLSDNILIQERHNTLKRNYNPKQLSQNYRSKAEVVAFNNDFFTVTADLLQDQHKNIYDNQQQLFNEKHTGGYTSIDFIDSEKELFDGTTCEKIHSIIKDSLENNFKLKDIAILCRKNSQGSLIADYLIDKGITVVSPDSLLLKKSDEINFIFCVLNYLNDNNNQIAKISIVQYLVRTDLIKNKNIHELISEVRDAKTFEKFLSRYNFSFNKQYLLKFPLYELCEALTRIFSLNKTVNIYISFFLDKVLEYTQSKGNNLAGFIEWWSNEKNQPSLSIPDNMDAVKIMTIHRSKGLEFPVVILPFANWQIKSMNESVWVETKNEEIPNLPVALLPLSSKLEDTIYSEVFEEEKNKLLLDNINLLYVAMTRAEERLHILTQKPGKNFDKLTNVTNIFANYLNRKDFFNDNQNFYEFGNKTDRIASKKKIENTYTLKNVNSTGWHEKVRIKSGTMAQVLFENKNDPKKRGILFHEILSKIKTEKDILSVLKDLQIVGIINEDEKTGLQHELNKILAIPEIKIFFGEHLIVKTEAEILLPNGNTYRPDRVIFEKEKTIVVDFKTGEENKKYNEQIMEYAQTLEQMGYPATERYIIYLDKEKVIAV